MSHALSAQRRVTVKMKNKEENAMYYLEWIKHLNLDRNGGVCEGYQGKGRPTPKPA